MTAHLGMRHRARRLVTGALVSTVFAATAMTAACVPDPSTPPTTTTVPSGTSTWALGDSQGANSNDPARGLPWTQRLGASVGNGADNMYGAGWTVAGTYTGLTIPQRAAALAAAHDVDRFIVMAGVNDLTAGKQVSAMVAAASGFGNLADALGAEVTWVGIVPFPQSATIANRDADRRAFNSDLAQRFGSDYVDCSPTMATGAGWLRPEFSLSPTDLHLNSAGEQALANCILAAG